MSDIPAEELKRRMRDAIAAREAADGTMTFSPEEAAATRESIEVPAHVQPDSRMWIAHNGVWTRSGREDPFYTPQPATDEVPWYEMGHTQLPEREGLVDREPSRQDVEAALAAREDDER